MHRSAKIQNDLRILTERLARINDALARKISSRNEYDKTIQETEGAYQKVRPAPSPSRPRRAMRVHCAPHRHPIPNTLPELRNVLIFARRSWRARRRCCMCSNVRVST